MQSEKTTAEKLDAAITESGLKAKFIAEKIGISEQALSAMRKGRQKIDIDTFFAIAVALHMKPGEILEFATDGRPN